MQPALSASTPASLHPAAYPAAPVALAGPSRDPQRTHRASAAPTPAHAQAHALRAPDVQLHFITHPSQCEPVRALFLEYQQAIGVDLGFQGFAAELEHLPEPYHAPLGLLLLATVGTQAAGCCAFRPLPDCDYPNACEMKRLYVRPAFQGLGLGRLLVEQSLCHAHQAGYAFMLLDTLSDMEAARALYAQAGFEEIPPYYHNPLPGAHYLKADLNARC